MSTSVSEQGRELIAAWTEIERGVAEWVLKLADFDASGLWKEDGHATCASWLVDRCQIARSTAFEKLKVAHELTRRNVVRTAFLDGLPYSKVRLLVRLVGVDAERDELFVHHAEHDSIRVLEQRVDTWNEYHDQDRKPSSLDDHYGIRRQRGFGGGLGKVVIEAPDDMLDRMFAVVDAYGDYLWRNQPESAMQTRPQAVDNSDGELRRAPGAQRLDWLFDLLEERALADPRAIDPYKATVGVTIQYEDLINASGPGLSSQGTWLTGEAVRRLACDAGIHRICSFHHHLVHEGGWTAAWNASTGVTRLEGPKGQILETTTTFRRAA
ncbi:MAG TPA: hypothetical protein VHC63_00185 [Acidimicrobiales bacterium]|nr:hypothetical protein [Acidimicrobiales bacterium]